MTSQKSKATGKKWAVVVATVVLLLALVATMFRAGPTSSQAGDPGDTSVIVPGLSALTIDGTGVTAPQSAVTGVSSQPLFTGKLTAGQGSATFEIPEAGLSFEVEVEEETGSFTVRAPQGLAAGTYTLLIDGETVATFDVSEAPAPGGDGDGFPLWIIIVLVIVALLVSAFFYRRSRSARA